MALFGKRRGGTEETAASAGSIRREVLIFTAFYLIFFVLIYLPPILRSGYILGGDGRSMYYPTLVNFRRSLLTFGGSIRSGQPEFPMMNFNFGFGADNLTTLANYFGLFPYFIFCVLMPESWLAAFLTASVFLLGYLAGLAFLQLCRHFGHSTPWNGLMAFAYFNCVGFTSNFISNPQFMYMMVAFPLMVIGIDRVIHRTGWKLLAFNVFWLCLTSFTMLIYTLPFLAVFALIRVLFCQREHFFRNLFAAFFRCLPVLLCGVLLASAMLFPTLYLLRNSIRSVGAVGPDTLSLLVPEVSRLNSCFNVLPPEFVSMFFVVPGLLVTMLLLPKRGELKTYLLAMTAMVALPFFDYALNGFQYSLVRWEFIPALVFAYAASVGMKALPKLNRKKLGVFIALLAVYWIAYSSCYALHYEAGHFCSVFFAAAALCSAVPPVRRLLIRLMNAAGRGLCRFFALLKGNAHSVKRYLALAAAVLGCTGLLAGGVLVALLPDYTFHITYFPLCGLTAAAALICCFRKPKLRRIAMPLLALGYFSSSVYFYWEFRQADYGNLDAPAFITAAKALPQEPDSFNRTLDMTGDAEDADDSAEQESGEEADPAKELGMIRIDSMRNNSYQFSNSDSHDRFVTYPDGGRIECNFSLAFDLPDTNTFHNLLDNDLHTLLSRCGLSNDYGSVTSFQGFDGSPALQALFGLRTVGLREDADPKLTYGMHEISSCQDGDGGTLLLYQNDLAMPVGVTYDSYMTAEEYDAADCAALPYLMMSCALTEQSSRPSCGAPAEMKDYVCAVTHEKTFVKENSVGMEIYQHELTLGQDVSDCFLYLDVTDVHCRYPDFFGGKVLKIRTEDGEAGRFAVWNENGDWPWIRRADRYAFNLGYQEPGKAIRTLSFEFPAEYGEMKVYAIPASVLTDACAARTAERLGNVMLGMNSLDGDITVSSEKLLSVPLIHNDGWRVFVDGKEQPLEKVNRTFLGVMLPEGTHHVRFVYRTPWLTAGLLLSGAGILLWIALCFLYRPKKQVQAA